MIGGDKPISHSRVGGRRRSSLRLHGIDPEQASYEGEQRCRRGVANSRHVKTYALFYGHATCRIDEWSSLTRSASAAQSSLFSRQDTTLCDELLERGVSAKPYRDEGNCFALRHFALRRSDNDYATKTEVEQLAILPTRRELRLFAISGTIHGQYIGHATARAPNHFSRCHDGLDTRSASRLPTP